MLVELVTGVIAELADVNVQVHALPCLRLRVGLRRQTHSDSGACASACGHGGGMSSWKRGYDERSVVMAYVMQAEHMGCVMYCMDCCESVEQKCAGHRQW